jgi:transglutaminase-like putative cysteine protease
MTPAVPLVTAEPSAYLGPDDVVQSDHREITRLAKELSAGARDDTAFAKAAYEWVRDQVTHSVDAQDPRVTVTATEVLAARTGLCYAKSHLLAALLGAARARRARRAARQRRRPRAVPRRPSRLARLTARSVREQRGLRGR